jgi:hypothetical protein
MIVEVCRPSKCSYWQPCRIMTLTPNLVALVTINSPPARQSVLIGRRGPEGKVYDEALNEIELRPATSEAAQSGVAG